MFQLLWLAFIPSFHTDTRSYLWKFPVDLQTFSWMSDTCTVNVILLLCSCWFCTKVNSMSCISLVSVRGWNVDTGWVDSLSVSLVSCQVWSAWKQTQLGIWATGIWFPELSCNSRARELPFRIYILCNFYIWLASAQSLSPGLGGPGVETRCCHHHSHMTFLLSSCPFQGWKHLSASSTTHRVIVPMHEENHIPPYR